VESPLHDWQSERQDLLDQSRDQAQRRITHVQIAVRRHLDEAIRREMECIRIDRPKLTRSEAEEKLAAALAEARRKEQELIDIEHRDQQARDGRINLYCDIMRHA
jgi:hypothetical protein